MNNLITEDNNIEPLPLRTVALYRVSTKSQGGEDNDLPTQKKLVQDFIWKTQLKMIREFTENGISGYKNLAEDRDAIISILAMAKRKEFDVLVIYHSNRLGRNQDDTPAIIKKLYSYKVKVISVLEGELKTKTPIDRLMNNIRYFGNEQESVFKSEAITDYHLSMVEEGRFRGGSMIPLGYKLVDNNSKNYKGKHILDFVIDEDNVEIIKLIYNLSIEMNYGQQRIAKYLNENGYKNKNGNGWHSTSIGVILNNPIYMGRFKMTSKVREKTVFSEIKPELIIIPPELWDRNQEIIQSRRYVRVIDDIRDRRETKNIYGKMLLNSIAFCGNCGMALTTQTAYKNWTTADGVKHKSNYYKYRCGSFYKKGTIECNGQSTYGTTVIEPIAIKYAKTIIKKLQQKELKDSFFIQFDKNINTLIKQKQTLKQDIEKHYEELKALQQEVVNVLMGKSQFDKTMLNDLIQQKQTEINNKTFILDGIDFKISKEKDAKSKYNGLNNELVDWEERFDNAPFEVKRLMLSKVIKRFVVYSRNEFEIEYDITIDTFNENAEVKSVHMGSKDADSVRTSNAYLQPISIYKETIKVSLAS
jgi:DNA invertase Pin-like site-specific DNA recombinase